MSSRSPRTTVAPHALALVALLFALEPAAQPKLVKVPGKRFSKGLYTAPDGEFALRFSEWLLPGGRANEQQVAASTRGVLITDDFGGAYSVMRTIDAPDSITVEKIADSFTVNELLREKRIVSTNRGEELRMLGVDPAGSPMVSRTREGSGWVERRNHLYSALSIFLDHGAIYRVTAGVTPLGGESEAIMFERATRKLEQMLSGLEIRGPVR